MSESLSPAQQLLQQNTALLRIYSWYRIALSIVLIAILVGTARDPLVGRADPRLFVQVCGAYLLFVILLLIMLPVLRQPSTRVLLANFAIDIAALIALNHISGATGGLSLLLLVCVAASGLMLRGQIALLIPALATLALLADTLYLLSTDNGSSQNLVSAATLGILLFATSLGFQVLSQRLRMSQQLALERATDISKLQNLNQMIVQRMRTGIVVADSDGSIKMQNEAAAELLHADGQPHRFQLGTPQPLPGELTQRLQDWRSAPSAVAKAFRISDSGPELIARFTALDYERTSDTLIFLEDSAQLAQRAQQLKLAALGRLTASIAHEIRNPLGAISHAGQLLRESPHLDDSDTRLLDIVLNHSRRINSIIENILQLSRRSPPNPRRMNLGEWLRDFVEQYKQGLEDGAASISIRAIRPAFVTVDPDQLGQVLTNLLDNALRYSKMATGLATAELVVTVSGNQLPQLDVVDNGPGIDLPDQEKIFEPFFTTESKGNGLGLYIARELCEINQARLHYLRVDNNRSCFRIRFSHPDRKPLINE